MPSFFDSSLLTSPIMVGRTSDLALLHTLVQKANSGKGQVAFIHGEAGIGKSRLVGEVKDFAGGLKFLLLQGNCFRSDRFFPFAPLLDLLRGYINAHKETATADLKPLAATLARLLPDLPLLLPELGPLEDLSTQDPEYERRRLFAVLTYFLTQLAARHPILLVIEDLHWCDEASLEFLLHLASRCQNLPLLILCTYRSDEFSNSLRPFLTEVHRGRIAQEIALTTLTHSEVAQMLNLIPALPSAPLPDLMDTIYPLTEGNPFFVEEFLMAYLTAVKNGYPSPVERNSQDAEQDSTLRRLPFPHSLKETVQQRTESLSAEARYVMTLAAVAGRHFNFALLQQVLGCDEGHLLTLMKELMAAQLVVEESGDNFSFRHALTRQAIFEGMLERERISLHRTIAEALDTLSSASPGVRESYLADLAAHYSAARLWLQALEYGQRLAERSLALSAPRSAVQHVTAALGAAHHLEVAPPTLLFRLRGKAFDILGEFESARTDYQQALHLAQEANDQETAWGCMLDLGQLWTGQNYQQAGIWFSQALELAQELAFPLLIARSLNQLGNWLVNVGQVEEGLRLHHQALDVFEELQDSHGMAETLDLLGVGSGLFGDQLQSVRYFERSIALQRKFGDPRALSSTLSVLGYFLGPCLLETTYSQPETKEACLRTLAEALQLAVQADWIPGQAFAELTTGNIKASFGEFEVALAHAHKALDLANEIAHQQWQAGSYCVLTHIHVLMLAPDLALQEAEPGLALARKSGSSWWINSLASFYALAYIQKNELAQAEKLLTSVMPGGELPKSLAERRLSWAWGELALRQGKPELALRQAEQLLASAPGEAQIRSQPIPVLLKLKGEALLALSRLEEARAVLEAASQGAQERHCPTVLWQLHRLLGQTYHQLKLEEQAHLEWSKAREIIEQLSNQIEDSTLREHFSHTALAGLPVDKLRAARRSNAALPGGLTGREMQVASLIAKGKSNREIADTLVISFRTVETHVANIMLKLDFSSRAQVAAWATRQGLTNSLH